MSRDERESGERALLNLGHTFGHAIETATQYQLYLHGGNYSLKSFNCSFDFNHTLLLDQLREIGNQ